MKKVVRIGTLSLVILCSVAPVAADAQRQYRCNGMIKYYPCDQDLFKRRSPTVPRDPRARPRLQQSTGELFAEVLQQSYQPAGAQGWWRGTVRGKGRVHLQLQILRNGAVESTRYMGNVVLQGKSTWFSFKSPVPAGRGWSWLVVASAS